MVLAQREGAAVRTADELMAVFIGDALEIIREDGDPSVAPKMGAWRAVADEYWTACPSGGWAPIGDPDAYSISEALADCVQSVETYLPASVWWEDGYMISRITGGPLDPREGHADGCATQRFDGSAGPCDCERVLPCGMCWRADVVYRPTGGVDDNGEPWTAPYDPSTGEPHHCAGMSDR